MDAQDFTGKTIYCKAWELFEYYDLIDTTHFIMLVGGRECYCLAAPSKTEQTVRLARIATDPLRQINRYVSWDQEVMLVPIENLPKLAQNC